MSEQRTIGRQHGPVGFFQSACLGALLIVASAHGVSADSVALVQRTERQAVDEGVHVIRDVMLANGFTDYVVRYEAIEPADRPNRVLPKKWAPSIGYTPVGIAAPSMALWYNQGFFIWTFDEMNLNEYRPSFEVVRANGRDATIAYRWDTPKATVTIHFAVVDSLDKLIMFGRYEPKTEIAEVKLKLMAYPGTFSKPWNRRATTATRTVESGAMRLDPERETWVLLEDVTEGRAAAGPAGLLLGDTAAFSSIRVTGIGGYAEYVDLVLAPDRREFVLGLYEMPSRPDVEQARAYFRQSGDAESASLAALVRADLSAPLPSLEPGDPDRLAAIREDLRKREREQLTRPAEWWRPLGASLPFSWSAQIPGPAVRVALLCPRWAAYDTMEMARRFDMEVAHQYFDASSALVSPRSWPYARYTGIGSLGGALATKNLLRICTDPSRDVIMLAGVSRSAIPGDALNLISKGIREDGKGLLICGGPRDQWPTEFFESPAPELVAQLEAAFPDWQRLPGLAPGEKGRRGDGFPVEGFRLGNGRIIFWRMNTGRYSAVMPLHTRMEGIEGGTDALYAMAGMAVAAAAGRDYPTQMRVTVSPDTHGLRLSWTGTVPEDVLVRVRDDLDHVLCCRAFALDAIELPALPSGPSHVAELALRNPRGETLAVATLPLESSREVRLTSIGLTPAIQVHEAAVPAVHLAEGGELMCHVGIDGDLPGDAVLRLEAWDAFDRMVAENEVRIGNSADVQVPLTLLPAATVCHRLEALLMHERAPIARRRQRFTVPRPYPYDEFTYLLWSYARREPVTRRVQRLSYDLGTDVMDLCHMRGYTDSQAAVEYDVASRSGLRLVPYVTRIANQITPENRLAPGIFNADWIRRQEESMRICTRQAAPYCPAAYTLGDENYLARGQGEFGAQPAAVAAFRTWLRKRYSGIDALNQAWHTAYTDFTEIMKPVWLDEAVAQPEKRVAWFDHRRFYDQAFVDLHERFARVVKDEDAEAKVGWDGLLRYSWQAGYDFNALCRNLRLNQVYTSHPFQGELVSAFAADDAFTGEWGNAVADDEAGFRAIAWHNLFRGHNSCWWWTSWGCDYIPFNPDTSVSRFGEWFFDEARLLKGGTGRLLLHAERDTAGIAVLYNQTDIHASHLAERTTADAAFAGDGAWVSNHTGLVRLLEDAGVQFSYVSAADLEDGPRAPESVRVLILPLATCLSTSACQYIGDVVRSGGTVIADGRVAILGADGSSRDDRPLDDLFGVVTAAGGKAFDTASVRVEIELGGETVAADILEPGLSVDDAQAMTTVDDHPLWISRQVGKGQTHMMNVGFRFYSDVRDTQAGRALLQWFGERLAERGIEPYAQLRTETGPARRIEQTLFRDGSVHYLCLQQDLYWRTDVSQTMTVTVPDKSRRVVDMRSGQTVARDSGTWTTTISRGTPRVFALLPYDVTGLTVEADRDGRKGRVWSAKIALNADGDVARHVVHAAVFAPDSSREHRQYSRNVDCGPRPGRLHIPFALNDQEGIWRVEFRDAASGVSHTLSIDVR